MKYHLCQCEEKSLSQFHAFVGIVLMFPFSYSLFCPFYVKEKEYELEVNRGETFGVNF